MSAEKAAPIVDDHWGYRAKRKDFLTRFGFPGTPAGDRMGEALSDLTDALLREARYHATWPVATAEKWRYDRMLWTFGIMLGEIPADTPAPPAASVLPPGTSAEASGQEATR